jgi:hypothetical protein
MYLLERFNGVVKREICNRSHLNGSIVLGFLTKECVVFCTDYMKVDKPIGQLVNTHISRLDGVGHQCCKKDLHVQNNEPNIPDEYMRAHAVVLKHL